MRTFKIKEKYVEVDDTKEYLDFYIDNGKPQLVSLDIVKLLTLVESKQISLFDIKAELDHLKRRVIEAPRKMFYRGLIKEWVTVLSGEYFFEWEGGEEIIQKLENTWKIAQQLLETLFDQKA